MIIHLFHKRHVIEIDSITFRICEKCLKVQKASWDGSIHWETLTGARIEMVLIAFNLHLENPNNFRPFSEKNEKEEMERIIKAVKEMKELIKKGEKYGEENE